MFSLVWRAHGWGGKKWTPPVFSFASRLYASVSVFALLCLCSSWGSCMPATLSVPSQRRKTAVSMSAIKGERTRPWTTRRPPSSSCFSNSPLPQCHPSWGFSSWNPNSSYLHSLLPPLLFPPSLQLSTPHPHHLHLSLSSFLPANLVPPYFPACWQIHDPPFLSFF